MAYRTVLVSLTNIETTQALLEVAMRISDKTKTHIAGLHVIPAIDIPAVLEPIGIPETVYEDHKVACDKRATEIRILFDESLKREGFSGEWVCERSETTEVAHKIISHARCSDVVVVSQKPKDGKDTNHVNLPEYLLMEAGRPVVVVPHEVELKSSVGVYPLVAWNGSKEATRAVFDAIPLLMSSKEVYSLWVNPDVNIGESRDVVGTEIATALARYDIPVKTLQVESHGRGMGETILDKVRDNGADLIVMGGYGRSRLREYVFGGATREILKDMSVPVLLSH